MRDVVLGTTPSFSQCMYRRAALEQIGGFRPEAGVAADHDLNIRLLARGGVGFCYGEIVMSYRLHPAQQTRAATKLYTKHMEVIAAHLGPSGAFRDDELLRASRRHWNRYFGRFMLSEAVKELRSLQFRRASVAIYGFYQSLPHSVPATIAFVVRRALGRFPKRHDRFQSSSAERTSTDAPTPIRAGRPYAIRPRANQQGP